MPKNTLPRRASAPKEAKIEPAAKLAPAASKLPEWLTAADPESMYQLCFRSESCDLEPLIELTRSEFIALKGHLAKLRGYQAPTEVANA